MIFFTCICDINRLLIFLTILSLSSCISGSLALSGLSIFLTLGFFGSLFFALSFISFFLLLLCLGSLKLGLFCFSSFRIFADSKFTRRNRSIFVDGKVSRKILIDNSICRDGCAWKSYMVRPGSNIRDTAESGTTSTLVLISFPVLSLPVMVALAGRVELKRRINLHLWWCFVAHHPPDLIR